MQNRSGKNTAKDDVSGDRLAGSLLDWYDRNARQLPWRVSPRANGAGRADPYHVWLSEIMLQQTRVAVVTPYYHGFLARWPNVAALAAAPLEDVLQAWAGLGYYARGRNLHKCAGVIVRDFAGRFPADESALKSLPGIGDYTAAAITAIAFGRPANVVDGNVERVVARLRAVAEPLPGGKGKLRQLAGEIAPQNRPGDYAQALMDLGATLCKPKNPDCGNCPWAEYCRAHAAGEAAAYPRRAAKKPRPVRRGVAYWIERDNKVLLVRRPGRGLLGGMLCFPGSDWVEAGGESDDSDVMPGLMPGEVRHTFTHFHLVLRVSRGGAEKIASGQDATEWVPICRLEEAGLPSVMRKVARHVLAAE